MLLKTGGDIAKDVLARVIAVSRNFISHFNLPPEIKDYKFFEV